MNRRQSSRNFLQFDTPDRASCDVFVRCPPQNTPVPLMEFDFTVGTSESYPDWLGVWWENYEGEDSFVAGSTTPRLATPMRYVEIGSYSELMTSNTEITADEGVLPYRGENVEAAVLTVTQGGEVLLLTTLLSYSSEGTTSLYSDAAPPVAFDPELTYHATLTALP